MGRKTLIILILLTTVLVTVAAGAEPWPRKPPRIGKLELKQEYWNYIYEASQQYKISPFLILAVCAIESRYDPKAKSGRCYGLMQLHPATAKKYGVNPRDPRENIMGGAAVLASLMKRYDGDIIKVLHHYNSSCTAAYKREILKAYDQALCKALSTVPGKQPGN
jgi:soluble lytic murein transglycosylase-like protein